MHGPTRRRSMPPRTRRTSARPLARCAQVFMILGDYGAHEISRWEQVRASVAGPRAIMMRCRVGRGAVASQLSKKIVLMSATSAVDSGGAAARDGAGKSIFTRMSECDPTQRLADADGGEKGTRNRSSRKSRGSRSCTTGRPPPSVRKRVRRSLTPLSSSHECACPQTACARRA